MIHTTLFVLSSVDMTNIEKVTDIGLKMNAENEKAPRPPAPVKLQPLPGCSRCRPQPENNHPTWFYRSKSGNRLPALTLEDLEHEKRHNQGVPEMQRLSRVQDWLRKSYKGGSMGDLDTVGEEAPVKKKSNKEIMEDARKWYQKKVTRTNETFIHSDDGYVSRPVKPHSMNRPIPGVTKKYGHLEPLKIDQKSTEGSTASSATSNSALKTYRDLLDQKPGPLPKDNVLKKYYERKKTLENYKVDRSFTTGHIMKDRSFFRTYAGPIGRPHTPVRTLAERQRSLTGDEAWFDRSKNRLLISDVRKMQSRTYELQSQLQQMLDKQQEG